MKRTDIKVNNEFIIKFCHSFHRRQKEVLQAKINDGKMSAYQANQNYITIIQEQYIQMKSFLKRLHMKTQFHFTKIDLKMRVTLSLSL